jgi:ABC-type uncharacterized transport system substrate-binding protein
MRRREFLYTLGGATAAWPIVARAQSTTGHPLIGVLSPQSAVAATRNIEALRAGLRELGYIEGRNIWLEFYYADGDLARLPALAAEFVVRKTDIIIAGSAPAILAAHEATQTIPILMNTLPDPVALGVVKSFARPGGNITGIWTAGGADALTSKRIALLKEVVPGFSRLGVVIASDDPTDAIILKLLPATTRALGVTYEVFEVGTPTELEAAFLQASRDGLQGLFISQNPFFSARRVEVAALAARTRLPAIYGFREHAEAGGLMSYGSSLPNAYKQIARLVDKVLKGESPAEIPVEQADKFELVINNKTAKALGLKIPESFLVRADEVIE